MARLATRPLADPTPRCPGYAKRMIGILIADSQLPVRAALRLLIEHEPDLQLAGEASDADALAHLLALRPFAVLLVDWHLPGLRARPLLRRAHQARPGAVVIAMSGRIEDRHAARAAGADAFIYKGNAPHELIELIRQMGHGRPNEASYGQDDHGHKES